VAETNAKLTFLHNPIRKKRVLINMKDWFLARIWHKLSGGWAPFVEEAVPAPDLTLEMHQTSVPSFGFFFMLALAAAIATFGLCLPTLWRVEEVCTSSLRIRQLVSMPYP